MSRARPTLLDPRLIAIAALIAAGLLAASTATASAAAGPVWNPSVIGATRLAAGETAVYTITIRNRGDAPAEAATEAFQFAAALPNGLTAISATGTGHWDCSGFLATATCTDPSDPGGGEEPDTVAPLRATTITLVLAASPSASGTLVPSFTVAGGGAPVASVAHPVEVDSVASFGVPAEYSSAGVTSNQAGAHSDLTTSFELRSHPAAPPQFLSPDDNARTAVVQLPAGFAGNPLAYPRCTGSYLSFHQFCPADTQVGIIEYNLAGLPSFLGNLTAPIYNMVPNNGRVAELAFLHRQAANVMVRILISVRPDDHGITATVPEIPGNLKVISDSVTIWGVPADPSHDRERGYVQAGGCVTNQGFTGASCPATGPHKPFLSNPTRCGSPNPAGLSLDSWQSPGAFLPTLFSELGPMGGCDQLEFGPTIEARPSTDLADSPSGLDFDLHIPQNEDPDGLATAHLRDTTLTLPEGLVVNPSSANGLGACSPAQIGLETPVGDSQARFDGAAPSCPDASKLGTVEVDTPVLDHPVPGAVYLAAQGQNPFGSLIAIYIVLEDDKSVLLVKLPAEVSPDPKTGRLTATLTDAPQLPFTDFHLHFFEGAGGALRTPLACGEYTTDSDLTPWSSPEGADAFPFDSFAIAHGSGGGACLKDEASAPNAPSFEAGTIDPSAGKYSPFVLRLARADGTQQLTGIDTTLPEGLLARLAGTSYCSDAALAAAAGRSGGEEQASPSCPASSQVGSVTVGAGAGPAPFYAQGQAYLAGPYKGAPLSLAVVTLAVAGPFDLGTVVVRTALHVDPESARVHAVSDPFPHILDGIPLDIRSIALNMDRSRFTKNPTSCDPMSITGSATTLPGQSAALSNPFQVGDCRKLAFKPKLALRLKGATKRAEDPALRATLRMREGGADISRAQVTLPRSAFLDQAHIRTICTRVQFAADQCPKGSVYGHARAFTPLLDQPLEGPVYLRSSNHKLPDLVADLNGQIHVVLDGRIDTVHGGIRTTFEAVPDAPVSKFVLTMRGGAKGLIQNSRNLCASTDRATVLFDAHNGKTADSRPVVGADCGKP